jgi:hypothetical protein
MERARLEVSMLRLVRIGFLGISLAACASSGSAGSGNTAMGAASSQGAAAALASKLGINESYVTTALSAAQAALGGGGAAGATAAAAPTPDQKAAAAQAGVDKASAQAQTDGKPLTDDQKTGLLDGLKGLL